MKHSKTYYKAKKYNGYEWGGFWDGYHNFTKKLDKGGYLTARMLDEDIENDFNFKFMLKNGFSR